MVEKKIQPQWLINTVASLSSARSFECYLEKDNWAIIKCKGHSAYVGRVSGAQYSQTEYILVEKGKGYWTHTWETVWRGRLTKEVKKKLQDIIEGAANKNDTTKSNTRAN